MKPNTWNLMAAAWLCWSMPGAAAAAELALEIHSLKPAYLVAEPILIDITLRNRGTSATEVKPELSVETGEVMVLIARGSGTFVPYRPAAQHDPTRMPEQLQPGHDIVHRQLLLSDEAFPEAGTYRLRALRRGAGSQPELQSNTIDIGIAAPSGQEAEAARLFHTREVFELILDLDESAAAVTNLELLMSRYGATTYGKYAQFYLARRQGREFLSRKPSHAQAARLYRELVQRDPQFPLATEAHFGLGVALARTAQYEPAREAFQFVVKESTDSVLRREAERKLEKIQRQ